MTDTVEPPSEDGSLESRTEAFRSRLDLEDVRLTKWSGNVETTEIDSDLELSVEMNGQYRLEDAAFRCRWRVDFPVSSGGGKSVGKIAVTFVETFRLEPGPRPEQDVIAHFMRTAALPEVVPYIREALESMSTRLRLGPIVLGSLHPGDRFPRTAFIRTTSSSNRLSQSSG
jgi:hypothetical protein